MYVDLCEGGLASYLGRVRDEEMYTDRMVDTDDRDDGVEIPKESEKK